MVKDLRFKEVECSPLSHTTKELVMGSSTENNSRETKINNCGITALYERLSRDDALDGDSNSIINQRIILEQYARDHGYRNIVHYDEDDGYTGTNFDRPGFQRMLSDIKAGKVSTVIVKDMSRLGRDYLQVGMYTDVIFPEFNVRFIAVNDGVDSTKGDNEFAAIRNIFNEMYARDTSKKVISTLQSKGKSGDYTTSNPPYGYKKNPDNPRSWLIDEEAAAVVQKIFQLCIDGLGPTQIANWLEENKVLSPTAYWAEASSPINHKIPKNPYHWNSGAIVSILERLEYLGHKVNFRYKQKSFKSKKKIKTDPSEWLIFENSHPAIISQETFDKVQNLRRETKRRPTRLGDMGLFSGMVRCGLCGSKMYLCRRNGQRERDYYVCSNYRKNKANCPDAKLARGLVLEELVLDELRETISYIKSNRKAFVHEINDRNRREIDTSLLEKQKSIDQTRTRIDEIDAVIKQLYIDRVNGVLKEQRFIKLSDEFEEEQEDLKLQLAKLIKEVQETDREDNNGEKFLSIVSRIVNAADLKSLEIPIIRELLDHIDVFPENDSGDKRVELFYHYIGKYRPPRKSSVRKTEVKRKKTPSKASEKIRKK